MPAAGASEPFVVPTVAAWRTWLEAHEGTSDEVWLALAKKGTTPTSLTYALALDVANRYAVLHRVVTTAPRQDSRTDRRTRSRADRLGRSLASADELTAPAHRAEPGVLTPRASRGRGRTSARTIPARMS